MSSGKVSGWARILSMVSEPGNGWLHLSGENHPSGLGNEGVNFDPGDSKFRGFAWESTAVGWVDFNGTVSTDPVDPPSGITGTCTVNGGSVATINVGQSANIQVVPSGGVEPYAQYQWLTGVQSIVTAGPSYSQQYNTAGTFYPNVTVTDDVGMTNSSPILCGEVRVGNPMVNPGFYIGRSPASATGDFFQVRQGTPFAIVWVKPASSYVCSLDNNSITPDVASWHTAWDDIIESPATSLSNLSTSAPIPRDTYVFGISCADTDDPPGPVFNDSVTLRILSATDMEI
jgi:hypothetical protein